MPKYVILTSDSQAGAWESEFNNFLSKVILLISRFSACPVRKNDCIGVYLACNGVTK